MKTRSPLVTLALVATAVAVHLVPSANEWLQFDRAALLRGEWWRWLTAHLTHFGANHLGWDVAVLFLLGWRAEHESRRRCAGAIVLAAIAITPAVWFWQPQFATYRGLSGIDSALFGLLAISLLRSETRTARLVGAIALAGFAAKCVLEIATTETVFASGTTYAPVPLAHVIGLVAGIVAGLPLRSPSLAAAADDPVEQL